MNSNYQRFEEICSLYGLYCIYRYHRRGRLMGVLVTRGKTCALWDTFIPEVILSVKAKSLKEPDWSKLEALVAEKAMSRIFTGG